MAIEIVDLPIQNGDFPYNVRPPSDVNVGLDSPQ